MFIAFGGWFVSQEALGVWANSLRNLKTVYLGYPIQFGRDFRAFGLWIRLPARGGGSQEFQLLGRRVNETPGHPGGQPPPQRGGLIHANHRAAQRATKSVRQQTPYRGQYAQPSDPQAVTRGQLEGDQGKDVFPRPPTALIMEG